MDEETKQKTNTRSKSKTSLRYEYIIVFCTVLMVTFIYALSLHGKHNISHLRLVLSINFNN